MYSLLFNINLCISYSHYLNLQLILFTILNILISINKLTWQFVIKIKNQITL